jgi:hypothetical protein
MRNLLLPSFLLLSTHSFNFSIDIPMRDATPLYTQVFVPDELPSGRRVGTILIRTPYSTASQVGLCAAISQLGWACSVSDERGKYQSGGAYTMWASSSNDTHDTISWLADQPFSNGLFAWTGGSANAIMGYVEPLVSPTLSRMRAQYNLVGTARLKALEYPSGAYREELITGWLTATNATQFIPIVHANELWGPFWEPTTVQVPAQWANYSWPTLHLAAWYDIFSTIQIQDALEMDSGGGPGARGGQILIIEAGGHCGGGAVHWPNASWGQDLATNYQFTLYESTIGAPIPPPPSPSSTPPTQAAAGAPFSRAASAAAQHALSALRRTTGAQGTIIIWYLLGSGGEGDLGNLWAAGGRGLFCACDVMCVRAQIPPQGFPPPPPHSFFTGSSASPHPPLSLIPPHPFRNPQ